MTTPAAGRPARLVVLGIDAGSPDLLDRWIADGSLPHLARLAATGTTGRTRGVEGFFIGATWPSMYTGTTPARHGVHYLLELARGTYELRLAAQEAFVRRPPFWRALSDAGQRVAVLDVPLTRLEQGLHGVQVVEWGGHDALYGFRTSGDVEVDDLLRRVGQHPGGASCDAEGRTAADYAEFVDRLERGARLKGEWTRELLARGGWDLVMQVFTEGHCAGHQCWHLHDPSHPAHDPPTAGAVGDPIQRAYRAIDRAIGEILEVAGDARVVVFSAHGMSHWYGAQFLLQDILVRLGAAVALPAPAVPAPSRLRAALTPLFRRLPAPWRSGIRALVRGRAVPPRPAISVDVTRSRCFPHPNGLAVGGIRLNLAGREPRGVLQPGADAEAFVAWLRGALLEIVDERTGRALVARVSRTAELFHGEHLDLLPDLLVEWSDEVATGSTQVANGAGARVSASSPQLGTISGVNRYGRTGEHRPVGWFVAAGPGIAAGRLDYTPELLDLAPTFTGMLGVSLAGCDGRPIAALVRNAPTT